MRTGALETQLGLDSLLDRDDAEEWTRKARFVIASFCAAGVPFTAEDMRQRMQSEPPAPNLVGAVFKSAASEGWIRQIGYRKARRPDAHGRVLAVWSAAS